MLNTVGPAGSSHCLPCLSSAKQDKDMLKLHSSNTMITLQRKAITLHTTCNWALAFWLSRLPSHKAKRNVILASRSRRILIYSDTINSFPLPLPTSSPSSPINCLDVWSMIFLFCHPSFSFSLPPSWKKSTVTLWLARNLPITLAMTSAVSRKSWHLPILERARKSSMRRTPML